MPMPEPARLSREIARWAAALRYEDLPEATVAAVKIRLLDMMAVAWAGSDADGIPPVHAMLAGQGGRGDATVLAYGTKLPAGAAAMINGAMAGALDFDGLHEASGVHSDIAVVPAALAVAERTSADGRALIAAIAAGEEILIRLGLSSGLGPGWFFSSVLGVFGAAIAAGKLLDLDADAMNAALGVAFCHATGSQQNLVENALTKRFQCGFTAQAGVLAADMASVGAGGPLEAIEGKFGLATLFTPIDQDVVLADLGRVFHMDELTLKKYPCCFCCHAGIEGALDLAERHDLKIDDILTITAVVPPFSERLVGSAFVAAEASQVAAQFSLPYALACALHRRRFSLADIELDQIRDPQVEALAGRVSVLADDGGNARFQPVRLVIETQAGAKLETVVTELPGTPAQPLSEDELRDKVRDGYGRGVMPINDAGADAVWDRVMALETSADAGAILRP